VRTQTRSHQEAIRWCGQERRAQEELEVTFIDIAASVVPNSGSLYCKVTNISEIIGKSNFASA
jgi:hypothetical protein